MNAVHLKKGNGLSAGQRKALAWFAAHGPACQFGAGDPSVGMVQRLCEAGLVETAGVEPGKRFPFQMYRISAAGEAALRKDQPDGA